ncbi:MAG: hypothetical protein ABIY52_18465 [Gemmatimonadaceae bacterium]
MADQSSDVVTTQGQDHRSTNQGRLYGNVSYPAEEPAPREDLRRRSSTGSFPVVADEHWTERPSRSTGARRRME